MPRVVPFDARGQCVRTHRSDACHRSQRPADRRNKCRQHGPGGLAHGNHVDVGRSVQLGDKSRVAQRVAHEAAGVGSLYRGVENRTQLVTKMLNGKGQ